MRIKFFFNLTHNCENAEWKIRLPDYRNTFHLFADYGDGEIGNSFI